MTESVPERPPLVTGRGALAASYDLVQFQPALHFNGIGQGAYQVISDFQVGSQREIFDRDSIRFLLEITREIGMALANASAVLHSASQRAAQPLLLSSLERHPASVTSIATCESPELVTFLEERAAIFEAWQMALNEVTVSYVSRDEI